MEPRHWDMFSHLWELKDTLGEGGLQLLLGDAEASLTSIEFILRHNDWMGKLVLGRHLWVI